MAVSKIRSIRIIWDRDIGWVNFGVCNVQLKVSRGPRTNRVGREGALVVDFRPTGEGYEGFFGSPII